MLLLYSRSIHQPRIRDAMTQNCQLEQQNATHAILKLQREQHTVAEIRYRAQQNYWLENRWFL